MTPEKRKQTAQRALALVDLTDLSDACDHKAIDNLCRRAQTPFGPTGAICIWPRYVSHAHQQLIGTGIPIATVVNFPGGNQSVDMTVAETAAAIADGAEEIDLVMPYRAFADGDATSAREMIEAVQSTCDKKALLKVIIESGELEAPELIESASRMAIDAGADFIKTSTGKVPVNATLETAEIMIQAIADSGKDVGFKPAGGIKSVDDCAAYLAIADRIMGPQWATSETFRFGASSVLDNLLATLDGREEASVEGY